MEGRSKNQKKYSLYLTLSIILLLSKHSDNKLISYNELKGMFQKYLDININDQDIHDFITEHDTNDDQKVSKEELLTALNYDLTTQ